jgi:glucose/arabinose dehydrogenase
MPGDDVPEDSLPGDSLPGTLALRAEQVAAGLANPVYVTAPAGDDRLFVVEQPGRIRIVSNGALLATPFLDITNRVTFGGERGLLSVAFDPEYTSNGRFYVYYTGAQGDIIVDRHTVSADPDVASDAPVRVIAVQHRSAGNHNGGLALFGPDGMLYLGTGDGGGAGDQQNNAQNTASLLGKLLRIDVRSLPYTVPPDNPFVGVAGADEIWAYGLRNPWRFAFDGSAGNATLYIADVGQNRLEEINAVEASRPGANYGWRVMEGTQCFNPSSGCATGGLVQPVTQYDHGDGCSVTGGFVYRGPAIPELNGHYFYADYCSGWLRSFRLAGGSAGDHRAWPIGDVDRVTSFGVDADGELYLTSTNGRVYRIVRQ